MANVTTIPASGPANPQTEMGRIGLVLRDALPWPQCRQVVETAEETGYEAVFVPEIAGREAFVALTGFAAAASAIRLGTGVVTIWARSPVTTAMAAASVQDLSKGRLILGIGAGTPAGPDAQDLTRRVGQLELVRRYVDVVRRTLAGELMQSRDPFDVAGFRLGLELTSGPPPIWLGALGDRMIALAGEVADGVVLNWCTPERVTEARSILEGAAERAGRDRSAVTVAVYARACLGVDETVALAALRDMTGQYAAHPHYLAQLERMGLGDSGRAAASAREAGHPEDVPESLVRALAIVGGRAEAVAAFREFHEAGADLVLCYPVAAQEGFSSVLGTVLAAAPTPAVER
jgi:alkanesulfonate monooxygenase SsuD/methylene tetrahydromethanopterin reductase-like flavin-dependent oxidoreductase (luciferase family)